MIHVDISSALLTFSSSEFTQADTAVAITITKIH